ncbi:DUF4147 domain-containing protein [Candidatus Peregrinibacteria bacterium]|nr:DUF4147 domain-containing protein [Candidatus Peregrinibacteria bacterium]
MLKIQDKERLLKNLGHEEKSKREQLLEITERVLNEINPKKLVLKKLQQLSASDLDIPKFENIYVIGTGKGAIPMACATEDFLGDKLAEGLITAPEDSTASSLLEKVQVVKASHPLPNEAGVEGAKQILNIADKATEKDLVIALISGGGSSLLPLPAEGITLQEKVDITSLLLKSGAKIQEINAVRKHLSRIKGGLLARALYPATCLCLVISDVLGDDLGTIASGPLAPDETTFEQAIEILKKYNLWDKTSKSIQKRLLEEKVETPIPGDGIFEKITTHILANHETAAKTTEHIAKDLNIPTKILTTNLEGEARQQANTLLQTATTPGTLYIATGETTVTIKGSGKGGRNQELLLSLTQALKTNLQSPTSHHPASSLASTKTQVDKSTFVALSIGTDGIDGTCPVPTTGAITSQRTLTHNLNAKEYLDNNDSYHFFEQTQDLIQTGPTGTNLGDLNLIWP